MHAGVHQHEKQVQRFWFSRSLCQFSFSRYEFMVLILWREVPKANSLVEIDFQLQAAFAPELSRRLFNFKEAVRRDFAFGLAGYQLVGRTCATSGCCMGFCSNWFRLV